MAKPKQLLHEVIFYREPNPPHKEPVRKWLEDFNLDETKRIGRDLMIVQYRWPIGKPLVDNIETGLWELRVSIVNREVRIFFLVDDKLIVL